MSSDAHASYFGQYTVPVETQATTGTSTRRSISNNLSTQTLGTATTTGNKNRGTSGESSNLSTQDTPVRQTQRHDKSPTGPEHDENTFQTNVVLKLDNLVQDFRQEKMSQMETLYQILCTLHDARLEEPDRHAMLKEYTLHVDIIASKHKDAVMAICGPQEWEQPQT
jgi:uncharacterized protein YjcR